MGKSSTILLIDSLLAAAAFSLFIWLEAAGIENRALVSVGAFYAFYRLLLFNKKALFLFGFFVGIFWFYWIGLSFRYVGMEYAVPLVMVGLGIAYALIFGMLGFIRHYYVRAAALLIYFDLMTPFGFEWLKPEILLVDSFFRVDKIALFLFLLSVGLFIFLEKRRYRAVAFLPLLLALDLGSREAPPAVDILLAGTEYFQDEKWDRANLSRIIDDNLAAIDNAIEARQAAVVLPESVFPMYLNFAPPLVEALKEKSRFITIVAGGLYSDGTQHFNSTYFFQNGLMQVAHKVVLVPFGESSDFLPRWMGKWVNRIFFDDAEDYRTAKEPTDFEIEGRKYRNAICYEATVERMYENAPPFMIAITNNAWYYPSTEPDLQRVVIRYFARKHGVIVYHSVNKSRSEIIY